MDGVSLGPCLKGTDPCPERDAFNETGIWIADVPGLPETHMRYPDLLELIEVPDRMSGTLAIKSQYYPTIILAKDRMIRTGRWKLVYQPLTDGKALYRLFDLDIDPECKVDVMSDYPDVAEALRAKLSPWIESGYIH
jgi:hypothetical protein